MTCTACPVVNVSCVYACLKNVVQLKRAIAQDIKNHRENL